jgi:hypothetical protein
MASNRVGSTAATPWGHISSSRAACATMQHQQRQYTGQQSTVEAAHTTTTCGKSLLPHWPLRSTNATPSPSSGHPNVPLHTSRLSSHQYQTNCPPLPDWPSLATAPPTTPRVATANNPPAHCPVAKVAEIKTAPAIPPPSRASSGHSHEHPPQTCLRH